MQFSKLFFFAFLILNFLRAFAVEKIYEYKWDKPASRVEISEEYQHEDAVIIYDSSRYSVSRHEFLTIKSFYTLYQRIRIQTQAGIDKYARVAVPEFPGSKIKTLDARAIKKDGSIVDFNNAEIKKMDLPYESLDNTMQFSYFSVPGVEAGDEIETIFVIENIAPGYQYFLHGELTKLESTYTLILPGFFIVDLMLYNEMPQPKVNTDTEERVYKWKMKNLKGTGQQPRSIPSLKLPFIIQVIQGLKIIWYSIDEEKVTKELWSKYGEAMVSSAKMDYNRSGWNYHTSIERLVSTASAGITREDTMGRISAVSRYLNENIEVVDESDENFYLDIGKMLEQKKLTHRHLFNLYVNLFEIEKIPYYIVFARERYNGPIDPKVPSLSQADAVLFAFQIADELHFLMPGFEADELPVGLQSTLAVLAKANDTFEGQVFLPQANLQDNFRLNKVKVSLDYEQNIARLDVQETLNGNCSSEFRHGYLEADAKGELRNFFQKIMKERCKDAELDSVFISKGNGYPQTFKLNYTFSLKNRVTRLEDNLFSFSFEDLFWHHYDEINVEKRTMDYYPLYASNENFKYFLMFDHSVELVNSENLSTEMLHPEIGKYAFTVKQVKENALLLESDYQTGERKVTVTEIGKLAELNEAIERIDSEPLLFKALK